MPTYSYLNKKTNEEFDVTMMISEMEKYEDKYPHLQRIYNKTTIVDPVGIGAQKPPADFLKHVVGRVKASVPEANKATLEKRWAIPREI